MKKMAGSGSESGSGSISQRHGSADPDPHQNVMDQEEFKYLAIFGILCGAPVGLASWVDQHDVLRLEVSMDEPQLLQLQQRRQHLYHAAGLYKLSYSPEQKLSYWSECRVSCYIHPNISGDTDPNCQKFIKNSLLSGSCSPNFIKTSLEFSSQIMPKNWKYYILHKIKDPDLLALIWRRLWSGFPWIHSKINLKWGSEFGSWRAKIEREGSFE